MPLVRMIINTRRDATIPLEDAFVNTLYFNVSGSVDEPNYQSLVDDLWAIWAARPWGLGRRIEIRAYNMDDPKPRPIKAQKTGNATGSFVLGGAQQVALALSYYTDRNLPRQRGRIFLGPWQSSDLNATGTQTAAVMALPPLLAGLGGLNVDWSLYSPTTDTHARIDHAWCDNSWDVIRSRKVKSTARATWSGNG